MISQIWDHISKQESKTNKDIQFHAYGHNREIVVEKEPVIDKWKC